MKELILRYSPSGLPVLILGESGTGKELVARAIHQASSRSGAFFPINCGAIPETLIESELFGAERGAYTGAVSRRGAFEQADAGSLFLDEIGDMPLGAQVKLLRVLEEKEVTRLGSSRATAMNVRVIAATNRHLKDCIAEKLFREDLFYRLSVLIVEVPSLKERKEDLPILAAHFLQNTQSQPHVLASDSADLLMSHDWPGNIRELRNVIERAALLADGEKIQPKHIVLY